MDYLLSECLKVEKSGFSDIELKSLTDFGVSIRYPDDFVIPSITETLEYKEIAFKIKDIVEEKIKY